MRRGTFQGVQLEWLSRWQKKAKLGTARAGIMLLRLGAAKRAIPDQCPPGGVCRVPTLPFPLPPTLKLTALPLHPRNGQTTPLTLTAFRPVTPTQAAWSSHRVSVSSTTPSLGNGEACSERAAKVSPNGRPRGG